MQFLDVETRRALHFDGIWARINPVSPLGRAKKRQAEAFLPHQVGELEDELCRLERATAGLRGDPGAADNLLYLLGSLVDLQTTLQRSQQGTTLDDTEFYEVKKLLIIAEKVATELERLKWAELLPHELDLCPDLRVLLSRGQGNRESFYLADAYDDNLAAVRQKRLAVEEHLAEYRSAAEAKVTASTGRILSMEGEIAVSRRDMEVITELEAIAELEKVQESAEAVTFRLKEDQQLREMRQHLGLLRAEEEACKERIKRDLTASVGTYAPRLLRILELLGLLDFLLAKARFCAEIKGVKPVLWADPVLKIEQGRDLAVEDEVVKAGLNYSPVSLRLQPGVTLISGPNMGGKTVSLKTVGLLTAMAQYGLLVPAVSFQLQPRSFIRAHLAGDGMVQGLSKFAREMLFLREAINHSQEAGLILIDELAHGTNPAEGAAVAQAVVERLLDQNAITVITTHFPSLARVSGICHYRVKGLNKEELRRKVDLLSSHGITVLQRLMDYRLEPAVPGDIGSDAVLVAEAIGLEPGIIARVKDLQRRETRG